MNSQLITMKKLSIKLVHVHVHVHEGIFNYFFNSFQSTELSLKDNETP